MCKSLYLQPGHLARCGDLWYEPGILLIVEAHEQVEVYTARNGMPVICRGSYGYAQLDLRRLPKGLRNAHPLPAAPTARKASRA
jgi:hypothetical protein